MTFSGTLDIRFLSDWHCGIGAGKHGGIDRMIARDEDGLPTVPGRTLKGMWRDASERAAHALDDGKPGEWSRLARRLFGDPALSAVPGVTSRGLVHVRDAKLTPAWLERLLRTEADVLVPGLRVTRAGAAIDDTTGTARLDHLRLIEFARAGLDLAAPFTVDAPTHWAVELLLGAGLRELVGLGAHRRRGAGRCRVTTDALTAVADVATEHGLEVATFQVDSVPWPASAAHALQAPGAVSSEPLVHAGRVVLTLRQPVVAARAVLGNLMLSHDFVPAATLLPLVADAVGPDFPSLVRFGRVIVTDAVPTPDKERLARTPLCVVSGDKGTGWLTDGDDVHDVRDGVRDPSDRPVGGWALRRSGGDWRIVRPRLVVTAHASIDDAAQRTLEHGVHATQAIPTGTRLAFDVWLPGDRKEALNSLPAQGAVGRYREDSYGLVDVEVLTPQARPASSDVAADTDVTFWLTSDAAIESMVGTADTTPERFAQVVADALAHHGVRATLTVQEDQTHAAVTRRDSWHGSGGRPRATVAGLAAGSSITVRTDSALPGSVLREVLDAGIGERRAEGYGRCEILPSGAIGIAPWRADTTPPVRVTHEPRDAEPTAWPAVRRACWRAELQQRIRTAAVDSRVRGELLAGAVTTSNLGSLRVAAIALASDPAAVDRWLEGTLEHGERGPVWTEAAKALAHIFGASAHETSTAMREWLAAHQASSATAVPDDLGGNLPNEVASWLLVECVRHQTLSVQTENVEEAR